MWFIFSITAFFLLSFAAVIDKFLLSKTTIAPLTYAFYISLGSAAISTPLIVLDPNIGLHYSDLPAVIIGGVSLFFAMYFMFEAVNRTEVSKANPLITSFIPISVFLYSLLMGFELISTFKVIGVFLVVMAGYLLSQVGVKKTHITPRVWGIIIFSAMLFGVSNIYSKVAYTDLPFISAFIWLRWSSLIGALIFVLFTKQWSALKVVRKERKGARQPLMPFILGQTAGSIGTVLLQYGIKLGNVILVTALNGLQFLFIILFVYLFTKFRPSMLHEDISYNNVALKVVWSFLLILGVVLVII